MCFLCLDPNAAIDVMNSFYTCILYSSTTQFWIICKRWKWSTTGLEVLLEISSRLAPIVKHTPTHQEDDVRILWAFMGTLLKITPAYPGYPGTNSCPSDSVTSLEQTTPWLCVCWVPAGRWCYEVAKEISWACNELIQSDPTGSPLTGPPWCFVRWGNPWIGRLGLWGISPNPGRDVTRSGPKVNRGLITWSLWVLSWW